MIEVSLIENANEEYKNIEYKSQKIKLQRELTWINSQISIIRQALQSQKAVDDGWLPIESAPKEQGYDNQIIGFDFQWNESGVFMMFWDIDHWQVSERDDVTHRCNPIHWQQLPQPPKQRQ